VPIHPPQRLICRVPLGPRLVEEAEEGAAVVRGINGNARRFSIVAVSLPYLHFFVGHGFTSVGGAGRGIQWVATCKLDHVPLNPT
jgi:hypothetical protein